MPKIIKNALTNTAHLTVVNPKNGLPLCRNHHKLFDQGLIKINPDNLTVEISVLNPESLNVTKHSLSEMVNKPSSECIKWLWSKD